MVWVGVTIGCVIGMLFGMFIMASLSINKCENCKVLRRYRLDRGVAK